MDLSGKAIEQYVLKENSFQLGATISGNQKPSSIVLDGFTLTTDLVFG